METGKDCGGPMCPACPTGQGCAQSSDCIGMVCANMICQPSCSDGLKNNGESDVDCGGPACTKCGYGKMCNASTDCSTANCTNGLCACGGTHPLISEVKSRGANGATDEFVELYNPSASPVTLDNTWHLDARSYDAASYVNKWVGTGVVLASHAHYLIAGAGYTMNALPDANLSSGISDAASLRLTHGAGANPPVVDAVCYSYSATTLANLEGVSFICEGTPVSNLPHNDSPGGASDTDVSIGRKPGGGAGNCVDSQNSSADFATLNPPDPQDLASAPTP
jgi:hypothetical protein